MNNKPVSTGWKPVSVTTGCQPAILRYGWMKDQSRSRLGCGEFTKRGNRLQLRSAQKWAKNRTGPDLSTLHARLPRMPLEPSGIRTQFDDVITQAHKIPQTMFPSHKSHGLVLAFAFQDTRPAQSHHQAIIWPSLAGSRLSTIARKNGTKNASRRLVASRFLDH